MKQKILSICIPVYNRKEVFKHCLFQACESCLEFTNEVEIVISDNNSEDDLYSIVDEIKKIYNFIDIRYNINDNNIGLCKNFLKVVEVASGEFCWIIGSDDFIKKEGVKTLLAIIKKHNDIDYICCNYDLIDLNKLRVENNKYLDIHQQLDNKNALLEHKSPTWSGIVQKFDNLIDPIYDNVFMGAVMTGIFRKSLWDGVEKADVIWDGFNSLESIYPHVYIYANSFIGKKAYYYGKPLITAGEGTREWATGHTIWESSLPLIHFKILGDIINKYRENGLDIVQYRKGKKYTANIAGQYFLPFIIRKYIFRKKIKDSESIKTTRIIKLYILTPSFYKGILVCIFNNCKKVFHIKCF